MKSVYRIYLETDETILRDANNQEEAVQQGANYLDSQGAAEHVCVIRAERLCPTKLTP